jgi:hypothetical protein
MGRPWEGACAIAHGSTGRGRGRGKASAEGDLRRSPRRRDFDATPVGGGRRRQQGERSRSTAPEAHALDLGPLLDGDRPAWRDGRGWPGMAGDGRGWQGMAGDGRGWPGMAGQGRAWPRVKKGSTGAIDGSGPSPLRHLPCACLSPCRPSRARLPRVACTRPPQPRRQAASSLLRAGGRPLVGPGQRLPGAGGKAGPALPMSGTARRAPGAGVDDEVDAKRVSPLARNAGDDRQRPTRPKSRPNS